MFYTWSKHIWLEKSLAKMIKKRWEKNDLFFFFNFLFTPGYAFLLFQEESSVQALIDACIEEDGKLYLCVSSPTIKDKPVSKQ